MKITLSVQDFGPHPRHHQTVLTPGIIRRSSPTASSEKEVWISAKWKNRFKIGSGPNLGGVKKKVDVGFTFIENI